MTSDESKALAEAIYAQLAAPAAESQAMAAVNAYIRSRMYTRRGMPRRSLLHRMMPPIPVPPDGVIPPWETGALLYELVESVEDDAAWERRQGPRVLWYRLCHQQRFERRVAWWRTRPKADRRAAAKRGDETAVLRRDWIPLDEKQRYGLRVAGRLVAQIQALASAPLGERDAQV